MDQPDIVIPPEAGALSTLAAHPPPRETHATSSTVLCAALGLGFLAPPMPIPWPRPRQRAITLAYRESSVPFSYLDNGKPIGMTVELSNAWPKP
jgi:hypothetical protein